MMKRKEAKNGVLKTKIARTILLVHAAAINLLVPAIAYAATPVATNALEGTKAYTGFQNLMSDLKTVILAVTGVVTIVLAMIQLVSWMKAGDDEQKKRQHKSAGFGIIAGGILVLCIEGVVMAVFSYFL